MELVFVQSPSGWECEVEVTAEFNLHIERGGVGRLLLYQKTPGGGKYDRVRDFNVGNGDMVIDYDSGSFIAPKTIKIESSVEPTYAALTTSGEVTEIKSQSKVVEVTSNGTTAVTPDAGYAYLSKVEVKTNVPQSGGSNVEYFLSEDIEEFSGFASVVKLYNEEENYMRIVPASAWATTEMNKSILVAIGLDLQSEFIGPEPFNGKLLDIFVKLGAPQEWIDSIPRITKEEFYNFDNGGGE